MTKLFLSLVSAFFFSSALAQVGINTSSPQSTLDVNGSIQIRDELRINDNPGQAGQIYFSQGNINDPQWVAVNIPFLEEGHYQLVNTYAKSDQVGIDFTGYENIVVFTENFESSSSWNTWTQTRPSGNASWTRGNGTGQNGGNPTSAYGGSNNARFVSLQGSGSPITRLISPTINLSSISNPTLSFYYAQEFWSPDQNTLKIYYRTSSTGSWTEIAHLTGNVSSWTQHTLSLPNPSSTYQIAFEGINNYGRANVIDNVQVYGQSSTTASDKNYYNHNLSPLGELIEAKNWTIIPGLDLPINIKADDNKISIIFQTGVESRMNASTGSQTSGNVRYICGLFQRDTSQPANTAKLIAVRGDQINNAIGKANSDKSQSLFTLNYTVDNTPAGNYTFSVACRRLALTGGGGTEATSLLSIGNSITSGTVTNDFMLNSILKMDIIELITVTTMP